MNTNKGINISKFLPGALPNTKVTSSSYATPVTNVTYMNTVSKSSISRILSYIFAIFIVILVILLFIHFFITPIFKLRPGAPGLIPVPGMDDGTLFWNKTTAAQIQNKDLPISSLSYGYSLNLDVFIQNPLQFETTPRIFFTRGAQYKAKPDGDSILSVLSNYNLAVALTPDTNDMIVSILNNANNMENIVVSNVPIQEPFRLGVIVMEQALEVYLNGRLVQTRNFAAPPKSVTGDIYPAQGILANMALVRNLKIWSRILTTAEIREAKPSLSTSKDFGATPMPTSSTSSTCSTAPSSLQSNMQKGMERLQKLSADTVPDMQTSLLQS
jgi:hypothetical protein